VDIRAFLSPASSTVFVFFHVCVSAFSRYPRFRLTVLSSLDSRDHIRQTFKGSHGVVTTAPWSHFRPLSWGLDLPCRDDPLPTVVHPVPSPIIVYFGNDEPIDIERPRETHQSLLASSWCGALSIDTHPRWDVMYITVTNANIITNGSRQIISAHYSKLC
jgi:hypothetical protein